MRITLYTGPHCELCDLAVKLIEQLGENVELEKVNIRESTELYHLYGARIPVIKKQSDIENSIDNDLGWPFSLAQLRAFIA
jgi:hypothetical protein